MHLTFVLSDEYDPILLPDLCCWDITLKLGLEG